jgi:hypothetical protein
VGPAERIGERLRPGHVGEGHFLCRPCVGFGVPRQRADAKRAALLERANDAAALRPRGPDDGDE